MVYQNTFPLKETNKKTGSGFKLVQNQFEKQMNNLPNWFKTNPSFSETKSPYVSDFRFTIVDV